MTSYADVYERVRTTVQDSPPIFEVRRLPFIGRHFSSKLAAQGIFSTRDLVRVAAARADPPAAGPAATRPAMRRRLHEFLSSICEAPRGARCVRNSYDRPRRTYLVRDENPGAFWALVAYLRQAWPGTAAGVAALTGGPARNLTRNDIAQLSTVVKRPRAVGAASAAAAATCTCRRSAAACAAAQGVGAVGLCRWVASAAAVGLPNWQEALAGVCVPRSPPLRRGSAEGLPGRTRALEPSPYPPPNQPAQAALVGSGGAAQAALARYARVGTGQYRAPLG